MTIEVGKKSLAQVKLAPDLLYHSSKESDTGSTTLVSGIDASSGLTTVISLTGKFSVRLMRLDSLIAEQITIKLTIDGVVIWNDTFTLTSTGLWLWGFEQSGSAKTIVEDFICEESLLLELQTTTASSVDFRYNIRPIL